MTRVICGSCRNNIEITVFFASKGNGKEGGGRSKVFCPNCGKALPSSKKELTGNIVGRKHWHIEWKEGDII